MENETPSEGLWTRIGRVVSGSSLLSGLAASIVTGALAAGITYLSTQIIGDYGLALFIAEPFVLGFVAVMLHARHEHRSGGGRLGHHGLQLSSVGDRVAAARLEWVLGL